MNSSELVIAWYETRDPALFADTVSFSVCESFPCAGVYQGPKDVYENFFAKLMPMFCEFRVERDLILEEKNKVAVIGRYMGRVKAENEEFAVPFTHVWTLDGGLVTSVKQHAETGLLDRAFAAA